MGALKRLSKKKEKKSNNKATRDLKFLFFCTYKTFTPLNVKLQIPTPRAVARVHGARTCPPRALQSHVGASTCDHSHTWGFPTVFSVLIFLPTSPLPHFALELNLSTF